MNLKPYYTETKPSIVYGRAIQEVSLYKNIPISELDKVRAFLKSKGITVRIRYRGPRNEFSDIRPKHRRMQDCLKQFANRFSVYLR